LLDVPVYESYTKAKVLFCEICKVSISYKGVGRLPRTCSSKCKNKLDGKAKLKEKHFVTCSHCNKEFLTSYENQKFCSSQCRQITKTQRLQSRVFIYECSDCKTNFVSKSSIHGISASTGTRCKPCQKQLTRIRDRKKTLIRQKAISNPRISVEVIARRDHYLCHLCKQIVDMDIKRTDKMGATIDHILPLSKGGLDTMENVALAHWICNIRKGNRV
jgi:DNA-directed RNA polymerase subunit RPC12/RpoP